MKLSLLPAEEQPVTIDTKMADGVFAKSILVREADTVIPQHAHAYDHSSFLASGAVRAWADDVLLGDFQAPEGILIRAGVKHRFQTLAPFTVIICIHNLHGEEAVKILEEHQLDAADLVEAF
ncbi:MAG TPA: hypothetical protein VGV37_06430 [Aliidongia sp.]|uniref:hypothetical protein n=1 Tax=Aliidongia sp. TaxID=1914230 RepID=UPI002DDD8731|nr:hypothetical protein [Aliidongia sp.]HEV2674162.1 hypothetical protein [Aliidongia sp.]